MILMVIGGADCPAYNLMCKNPIFRKKLWTIGVLLVIIDYIIDYIIAVI